MIELTALAGRYKYPLIFGIITGALISLNAFISTSLNIRYSDIALMQYLPSIILLMIAGGIYAVIPYSKPLWQKKETILIVMLVISSQTKGLTSLGSLDLSDLTTFIILLIWLTKNFTNIKYNVIISPLCVLTFLFISCMLFSSLGEIGANRGSLIMILGPLKWFLMMLMIVNFLRKKEDAIFLLKVFLIVTFISGIIGIVESLIFSFTGYALHTGKYDFEMTSMGLFLRAQAYVGHIHGLATLLAVIISFLFMMTLYLKVNVLWKYRTIILMIVITGVAIQFTFYKGSWIAFGIAALFGVFLRKPSYTIHFSLAVLLGVTVILSSGMLEKIQETVSEELYVGDFKARRELDKGGVEGFLHGYPVTGTGYGNNRVYVTHPKVYPAHNAFIQVAGELGLPGLITYSLIYVYLFYRLVLACLLLIREEEKIIAKGLLISFIAFIIISQFEPLAFNFWFWLYFAVLECVTYIFLKNRKIELSCPERVFA